MNKSIIKLIGVVTTTFFLTGCGTVTGNSVGNVTNVSSKDVAVADESDTNNKDITTEENGNFIYRIKEGYSHDGRAAMEYTYNGMKYFFGKKNNAEVNENNSYVAFYTAETAISDVINDPAFNRGVQVDAAEGNLAADNFGRLLFPANTGYYSGTKLNNLSLTWYGSLDTKETVEIVNTLKTRVEAGDTIFFDIYSDDEKKADPDKEDTGLFFFRGRSTSGGRRLSADRSGAETDGAKTAICNAGGGFVYVGAMQDSFPHALELSKMGYNAFVLIYRPGWDTAMEDLGRALSFLYDHAEELDIDMEEYSLWGGSAGARMAATLGNSDYLHYYTGRTDIPQAAAVIMQYTGHTETSKNDAPTYACVGTRDGIANWQTMENRLDTLTARYGIPTEFHSYEGLGHGFGLGTGTVAEGWINDAVSFWETQIK